MKSILNLEAKSILDGKYNPQYQSEYYTKIAASKRKVKIRCEACNIEICKGSLSTHIRTDRHRKNIGSS